MNNDDADIFIPSEDFEETIANHLDKRFEKARSLNFSLWLITNSEYDGSGQGGYAYYIANEIRRELPGVFADSLHRILEAHSGCAVPKFVDYIPEDWQTNDEWSKKYIEPYDNGVRIYDEEGCVKPL